MVEQIREFDVEFLSDRGDLGAAETAELVAQPVECEKREFPCPPRQDEVQTLNLFHTQ
ncbi:hypothetical protein [Streptomyces olivochromogenes]|uniref:hypothetical protein n=1 Tax=Streptomyces olivochromogenes TaxID=1963 RepID=UPI00131A7BB9|nr:hypothetical protein [Streptomyces olivochromogenes]